jgi:hypothetical protein
MVSRTKHPVPHPPRETESDTRKAEYYARYDPVDLMDAGYLEEDGLFQGDRCLVNLRPERGLVRIPVAAAVARKLRGAARRAGCTPCELASRCLARELQIRLRR